MNNRIDILVASPNDVKDVREAVPKVFVRWNSANDLAFLHPEMWESSSVPEQGSDPQAILDRQLIDRCELLIAIFWARLGTPTPREKSGTVEEIREFSKRKGAARVMVYFCERDVPINVPIDEFSRFRDFKEQMKSEGLYQPFTTVQEFEALVYRHLDKKVRDLLEGRLTIPKSDAQTATGAKKTARGIGQHADPRLSEGVDFGVSLQEIAQRFSSRMEEFRKIDGAGRDKFLDLGAHMYHACADCLDRLLSVRGHSLHRDDKEGIDRIISRLRGLGDSPRDYISQFPTFWKNGDEIAEHLISRATRMTKR